MHFCYCSPRIELLDCEEKQLLSCGGCNIVFWKKHLQHPPNDTKAKPPTKIVVDYFSIYFGVPVNLDELQLPHVATSLKWWLSRSDYPKIVEIFTSVNYHNLSRWSGTLNSQPSTIRNKGLLLVCTVFREWSIILIIYSAPKQDLKSQIRTSQIVKKYEKALLGIFLRVTIA